MSEKIKKDKIDGYDWLKDKDPEAMKILSNLKDCSPQLVDLLIKNLYGELYQRDGLELKTRLLLTIVVAASIGAMPQVLYQSRLAMICGVTIDEIYESLFSVAIFAGFSNAMNAMNVVKDAAATIDVEL